MRFLVLSALLVAPLLAGADTPAVPPEIIAPDSTTSLRMAVGQAQALAPAPLIPRNVLLSRPLVSQAFLSPDSRYVVHKERQRKRVAVILTETASGEVTTLLTSKAVGTVYWLSDSSGIVFTTNDGIASINVDAADAPILVQRFQHPEIDTLLATDVDDPAYFFAQLYDPKNQHTTLYRLGLDGTKEALHSSARPIMSLLQVAGTDRLFLSKIDTDLPAILSITDEGPTVVLRCAADEVCRPVMYDLDQNELLVIANQHHNLSQLLGLNLGSGQLRTVHKDSLGIADIDGIGFDPDSGRPLLASYWRTHKKNYGLSEPITQHITEIEAQFPAQAHLSIIPRTDSRHWLVTEQLANRRAFVHYLYQPETKTVTRLQSAGTDTEFLSPDDLAPVVPFSFSASDGMRIYAYLTLPRGLDLESTPLVVLPHGGPWNRVRGTYQSFSQFLANRGYIVYEPNFRASSGYGREYLASANRDFGDGRVQDDIVEGLEYLLGLEIGDRQRLGIFGHSFGGFSTLAALAFTPNLFRVGIAGAPPADLSGTFMRMTKKAKFFRENPMAPLLFEERMGGLDNLEAMRILHEKSPLAHADKVIRPLLILAGKKDDRVSADEVFEYAIAMDSMNKPISLLMAEDEGHSYRQPHTREAYLYLLESILAKHLGGRSEPLNPSDEGDRKLVRFVKKSMKIDRLSLAKFD